MDNPTTLLVAIMFVTIVVTGLVGILMFLSDLVTGKIKTDPLHTSWLILLLIAYLNFFWQTTLILEFEHWNFSSFLAFIVGPIALLFATNLLATLPDSNEPAALRENYLELSRRFFALLLLVQLWIVLLDFKFGLVSYLTWLAALVGAVFVVLVIFRTYRVHLYGTILVWVILLTRTIVQSL